MKEKDVKIMEEANEEVVADYIRGTLYELRCSVTKMIAGNSDDFDADKISEEKFGKAEIQNYSLLEMVDSYIQGLDDGGKSNIKIDAEMPSKYKNREVPVHVIQDIITKRKLSISDIASLTDISSSQIRRILNRESNPHNGTREKLYKLHEEITLNAI